MGISLVFLLLFLLQLDGLHFAVALAGADYRWLLAGIPVYFAGLWFRTLRWQALLQAVQHVRVRALFPYMAIGYMANDLLPVRIGELVRVYLTGRRFDMPRSPILATIVLERVSDGLVLVGMMAVAAVAYPVAAWVTALGALMAAAFGGVLALLVMAVTARSSAERVGRSVAARLPVAVRLQVMAVAGGFMDGMAVLRSPRWLAVVGVHAVLSWLWEAAVFYTVGLALGIDVPFVAYVLAMATANLATALPSSQAGIGPFEFFCAETLQLYRVPAGDAVAFALLVHVVLIVPVVIAGLVYLAREQVSLSAVAQRAMAGAPAAEGR